MLSLRFLRRHLSTGQRRLSATTGGGGDDKLSPSAAAVKSLLNDAATFDEARQDNPNHPAGDDGHADTDWATLPYPEGTHLRRDQSRKSQRSSTDPRDTSIILFPGQGAQHVGMAANLVKFPGARDIFEMANEVLK